MISQEVLNEVVNYRINAGREQFKESFYQEYKKMSLIKLSGVNLPIERYLILMPGQSYGPIMERFFIRYHNCKKVPSSVDRGDFKTPQGVYGEHKFSFAHKRGNYKFNFVQIRPWQLLDHYIFEVYQEDAGFFRFKVPHDEVLRMIDSHGGLAHGTIATNTNEKKEYALRGKVGGELWGKLMKYCVKQPK